MASDLTVSTAFDNYGGIYDGGSLHMLHDFSFKKGSLLHTYCAPYRLAVFEENQSRNRLHTITGGQLGALVNVNFDDVSGISDFGFHLFENRGLHFAGATPCGKKIYQSRFILVYEFVKIIHNI